MRPVVRRGPGPLGRVLVPVLLLLATALLFAAPLVLRDDGTRGEYTGTDGQAVSEITRTHPGYRPWAPALPGVTSTEVQSGLFALQAGLGGLALGYVLGRLRGRRPGVDDRLPAGTSS